MENVIEKADRKLLSSEIYSDDLKGETPFGFAALTPEQRARFALGLPERVRLNVVNVKTFLLWLNYMEGRLL